MPKTIVVLFLEGATEVEFYKKLVTWVRAQQPDAGCRVDFFDLSGVGEYAKKAGRIFEKRVKPKYRDARIKVGLCYDSDVFEFSQHPPVDWDVVVKNLKERGAAEVLQIVAKTSIEDWFLKDPHGLRKFLRLSQKTRVENFRGCKGLQELFRKAGKVYVKGSSCKGLVEHLDMSVIAPAIAEEINIIKGMLDFDSESTDTERTNGRAGKPSRSHKRSMLR
ncbi:MAG: hypothetical protein IJ164_03360 [Duodenibacillus sp.]|nr:hypothetical protein [Duodenibacillus sp.]